MATSEIDRGSRIQQRQREHFQIEPAEPIGVVGIQTMPLDAMLSESRTQAVHVFRVETCQRRTPVTIWDSTADQSDYLK